MLNSVFDVTRIVVLSFLTAQIYNPDTDSVLYFTLNSVDNIKFRKLHYTRYRAKRYS